MKKPTEEQIEKVMNNTYKIGIDITEEMRNKIWNIYLDAEIIANIKKSSHHYTLTDRKKIYRILRELY